MSASCGGAVAWERRGVAVVGARLSFMKMIVEKVRSAALRGFYFTHREFMRCRRLQISLALIAPTPLLNRSGTRLPDKMRFRHPATGASRPSQSKVDVDLGTVLAQKLGPRGDPKRYEINQT